MKIPLLALAFLTSFNLQAQYYYNDIVATHEANSQMQAYLNSQVKMITATGYDANNVKATDFAEAKEISEKGRLLKVSTRNSGDYSVYYNRYDEKGRIISTTDSSSELIRNIITYQYNDAGRITSITTVLKDSVSEFSKTDEHLWKYDAAGKPEKMWRIINGADSIEIRFVADENGNPGEEITYRWGLEYDRVYYYFDAMGRVTDIVRYNNKVKKLLPDVILTYDDKGRIIQKITSTPGENYGKITWVGYIIWRYIYNDKGLKIKEALFDKDQRLTGKIEYSYTYNP